MAKKKAVVLFSGGLDSTTCIALANADGFDCYALTIHYGQKHNVEVEFAKAIAAENENIIEHRVIYLPDIGAFGGSALTDATMHVPDYNGSTEIPTTYVPARNTIFLSLALAWAEVIGANDIFFGANCIDYSQYPDCRPDYIDAFEKLADLATKAGVSSDRPRFKIHAPLLTLNKAQIIQLGMSLGIDYSRTISCYRANDKGAACGTCDSCAYRKRGFTEAGLQDPTRYI